MELGDDTVGGAELDVNLDVNLPDKTEVTTTLDSAQIWVKTCENTVKFDESDCDSYKAPVDGTIGFIGPPPTVNICPQRQRKPP